MFESGEYFYSIAALFSLSAYLLTNMLWLRILLVLASVVYIISGISLGITSMVGWNSAYLAINLFYVVKIILEKSTITLPEETRDIYRQFFSSMSTREFKKIITVNPFVTVVKDEVLIAQNEVTDRLFIVLKGKVNIEQSGVIIDAVESGDLIGEMSFMSNQPASASAVAIETVQYAYWSHKDMGKINQKNCEIYNKFISIIGQDLIRKLNKKNEKNVSRTKNKVF